MTITHVSRTGKVYYLHAGLTKTGKQRYFFSQKKHGEPVDTIPDGFEIYENIEGQVFLRRIPKQIITPQEREAVETALRKHGEAWEYQAEVKKNTIVVYAAGSGINAIDDLARSFGRKSLSDTEKLRFASYMAVMRFVLDDLDARLFTTERFCFKGSVDDWIYVDGPEALSDQLRKYVKHLGRDSFYELF